VILIEVVEFASTNVAGDSCAPFLCAATFKVLFFAFLGANYNQRLRALAVMAGVPRGAWIKLL